jgi:cyanate permease
VKTTDPAKSQASSRVSDGNSARTSYGWTGATLFGASIAALAFLLWAWQRTRDSRVTGEDSRVA